MTEIKRILMVDDSIRDMAARLAVTMDVEIEEALGFALITTIAMIAGSGLSDDEIRRIINDTPPRRQDPACRLP